MATTKLSTITGVAQVVPIVGQPTNFTPTITLTGSTLSNIIDSSTWTQFGEFMQLDVSQQFDTAGSTPSGCSITIPSTYTIGGRSNQRFYGNGRGNLVVANQYDLLFEGAQGATAITMALENGNTFAVVGASKTIRFSIMIPILQWAGLGNVAQGAGLATAIRPGIVYRSPQTAITVTGTGWTTTRAVAIAYMDNNGIWRITYNVTGTVGSSARTTYSIAISGTTFGASNQSCSGHHDAVATAMQVVAQTATGNIVFNHGSATTTGYTSSGDVELASKPTWA